MKIGLDIHGVIDKYPDFFKQLAINHIKWGNEIHIITGPTKARALNTLNRVGFTDDCFTHFFSIVDYNRSIGTKMWRNENGTWEMSPQIWWKTKSIYWNEQGIDIHYDNDKEYNIDAGALKFILVK